MSKNRGVVYMGPGKVEVQDNADPKFEAPDTIANSCRQSCTTA